MTSFVRVGLGFGYMRIENPPPSVARLVLSVGPLPWQVRLHGRSSYLNKSFIFCCVLGTWYGDLPGCPPAVCVFIGFSRSLCRAPVRYHLPQNTLSNMGLCGIDEQRALVPSSFPNRMACSQILSDDDSGRDLVNCWQVIFLIPCERGTHIGRWWCWRGTLLTLQ